MLLVGSSLRQQFHTFWTSGDTGQKSSAHRYTAEVLYLMLNIPQNIVYLTISNSVLGEVQSAIKAEGEQVDPLKPLQSLISLIKSELQVAQSNG